MTIFLFHSLLTYFVPFSCGLLVSWLTKPFARTWHVHVLSCLAAIGASIVLGYAGFLVFAGVMTNNWPQAITLAGLVYGLAWFAIPAVFTSVPLTVIGYVCGTQLPFCAKSARSPGGSAAVPPPQPG